MIRNNIHWDYIPFCDAVEICDNQRKPINSKERAARIEGKHPSELYPYYGATGQVGFIDDYITDGEYVLLGEDGAPFLNTFAQKAYIISGKAWVNNHAHVLRSKGSNKFLCYYLNCFNYKGYVSGTTRLKLTQAQMKMIPVPVPSIEEQERIVARIEELFSELDNGVETLRKTKQQLAVYRQAVLCDAFSGLDTFTSLQAISERIFDGPFGSNLKTADYTSSGIRVVRLENLKDGWFDDSKQSFVTQEKYDTISSHTVYPTDLIMSTFVADSIKVCQMPQYVGFAVNKADCIGIRLKTDYVQQYVMYYLMTKNAYNALVHDVHGATRPRVNTKQIKGIKIPVCDLSVQRQIVANIESRLSVCDSIEKTVDTALQQAEAMRQSILKQAFEGRLYENGCNYTS